MKIYVVTYFIDTEERRLLQRTDYIEAKNRARAVEYARKYVKPKWSFIVSEFDNRTFS